MVRAVKDGVRGGVSGKERGYLPHSANLPQRVQQPGDSLRVLEYDSA